MDLQGVINIWKAVNPMNTTISPRSIWSFSAKVISSAELTKSCDIFVFYGNTFSLKANY